MLDESWGTHVAAHVRHLQKLVRSGSLRASGPLKGTPKRAGFLIFQAANLDEVNALVADDPFAVEGLIETLSVSEWDPLFGVFASELSGGLPGFGSTDRPVRRPTRFSSNPEGAARPGCDMIS